jgi:DNA repair ATPase RecN
MAEAALKVETGAPAEAPISAPAPAPANLDQLSRIEEKAARIEEKFARYEAVLNRAEMTLERGAHRLEDTAKTLDFDGLGGELKKLNERINATPRFGALMLSSLASAVLGAVLVVILFKTGLIGR